MKKLLRPKDVLLLGLAGMLDVFEEVKHPLGISAVAAKELYGWVPARYKKRNFGRVVERGLRTGFSPGVFGKEKVGWKMAHGHF